jgi:hypothetical protein
MGVLDVVHRMVVSGFSQSLHARRRQRDGALPSLALVTERRS